MISKPNKVSGMRNNVRNTRVSDDVLALIFEPNIYQGGSKTLAAPKTELVVTTGMVSSFTLTQNLEEVNNFVTFVTISILLTFRTKSSVYTFHYHLLKSTDI